MFRANSVRIGDTSIASTVLRGSVGEGTKPRDSVSCKNKENADTS